MWAFGKYIYFSKATTCIRGLVFSHSFANHAIMSILITYLTHTWKHPRFQIAAIVTNLQEGASDIMIIVFTHVSHTYKIGCFNVIATTNAAYILGLLLLWYSSKYMSADTTARVFYGAVILLAMGEAGRSAALEEFLDDQYSSEQDQIECTDEEREQEKRVETRRNALWSHPWFLGAVVPLFLLNTTWTQIFLISAIGMGVSYLLFWGGFSSYFINNKYNEEEAWKNRQVYLDKQADRGNLWTVIRKLKKKKHFRKEILSMWLSFLVYSVVTAAGSTFFFEQMSNLKNPFDNYDPAVYFSVLNSLSKYLISFLYGLIIPKRWVPRAFRMRIGIGMAFTVLSCGFAWRIEIHRLEQVYAVGEDSTIPMSIFWLVPQFIFLGVMEGLVIKGVIGFLVDQLTDDDDDEDDKVMAEYYGSHTTDFFLGIGKLLTALSILAFKTRWFDDDINWSRLDKYYRALTFLSLGSFCYYLCVAYYFYPKDVRKQRRNRSATVGVEMVENP